jgi:MFS family permease
MLSLSTGVTGIISLFVNQIGGKLADAIGRLPLLQVGSVMNILVALIMKRSKSPSSLLVCRVLKLVFTTFSGTVIGSSILSDTVQAEERRLIGPQVMVAVSAALISGPIVESAILRRSGDDPRAAYTVVACLNAIQLFQNHCLMPETLCEHVRTRIQGFAQLLAGMNPFSFLKLFFSEHTTLKKVVLVQAFQMQGEGKVSSDFFQIWSRVNLKWSDTNIRDFVSSWGAIGAVCNAVMVPTLHQRLNIYDYTCLSNIGAFLGLMIHSAAEKGICMWGALPFFLPGVNGSSANATGALSVQLAKQVGYGNAEFAAWMTNIKAISQSLTTLFLGWWYARCKDKGKYPGTTWMLYGLICGAVPQLLVWKMGREEFKAPMQVEGPKETR